MDQSLNSLGGLYNRSKAAAVLMTYPDFPIRSLLVTLGQTAR